MVLSYGGEYLPLMTYLCAELILDMLDIVFYYILLVICMLCSTEWTTLFSHWGGWVGKGVFGQYWLNREPVYKFFATECVLYL